MRQTANLFALSLVAALGAQAYDASVYTFDRQPRASASHGTTLPQDAAKLIIERRMMLQGSLLGSADDEVVGYVDQFGGQQQSLFGLSQEQNEPRRQLLVLEGADSDLASAVSNQKSNNFNVHHVSGGLASDDSLETLIGMSQDKRGGFVSCAFDVNADANPEVPAGARECLETTAAFPGTLQVLGKDSSPSLPMRRVESWSQENGAVSILKITLPSQMDRKEKTAVSKTLSSLFDNLSSFAAKSEQETTVLFLPLTDGTTKQKRNARYETKENTLKPAVQQASSSESSDLHTSRFESSVPSTLMPVCYLSESACVDATNNCSGHGQCYRKYGSKDDASRSDCYACKCVETVEKGKDGSVRTVQWGGPACQKKDVSTPFFLLAGITVGIVFAVASGIGMLFSVGQQELPSVIGAGVGAPKAQR
ncbi:conserved hypothetical protein [Paecilomyces variotii No. 5]|uniref:Vacuolar sorting protein Vps3844 C-terminal domain-containing protein n=1 Tax=Byssochlamys spectabilis (strain No. 5 / NBRC 109023) TaxID=1356009 RepID=V5G296_BYSSN|nr:conserved hypothetical protein [Paecilomyces variotii No. 5]